MHFHSSKCKYGAYENRINVEIEKIPMSNLITKHAYLGCFTEKSIPMGKINSYMIVSSEYSTIQQPNMGHWIHYL